MKLAACCCLLAAIACGHQKRTDRPNPSNVMMITAEDIESSPGVPLEELLASRIPGVTLTRADDGRLVLHIRGTTTVHGPQEPLVVLDGIPLGPNPAGNLRVVNPYDIATLEVLRDAAGIAMYGVRGGSGVIVIKTKQP
jgi:TonB-dependent starch-binding outer membrane protein SusC